MNEMQNRTGITAGNGLSEAMQKGTEAFGPTSHGSTEGAGMVRIGYAREGYRLGSVPQAPQEMAGLMDKLGERLAFERTGTRLYEALVSKHDASGGFAGGPSRKELVEILEEEHRHFALLEEKIRDLGGDPTAITPSADLAATAAEGVMKVITDPRASLLESLEAIMIAELTDREGWTMLLSIAEHSGRGELIEPFAECERREEEHLSKVRGWVQKGHDLP